MKNLSLSDVRDLSHSSPDSMLVLHYESTDEATFYTPEGLLSEIVDQAVKKYYDGEFDTLQKCFDHMESISYICTKEDYEKEQEDLK